MGEDKDGGTHLTLDVQTKGRCELSPVKWETAVRRGCFRQRGKQMQRP